MLVPLAIVAVVACAPTADSSVGEEITPADPQMAGPSADLAPSQRSLPTVPRPVTPPRCAVVDLAWWTAQIVLGDSTADAVLRVRNDGDEWCEVDIGASAQVDPAIEPNVWLEPGDWADLLVGQQDPDCGSPTPERSAVVGVNGEEVDVPTALVTCGWMLTSFVPIEPAVEPCRAAGLEAAVVGGALILRNSSSPCVLGALVAVGGGSMPDRGSMPSRPSTGDVTVAALSGGDVVAFPVTGRSEGECSDETTTLRFEVGGEMSWSAVGGCLAIALGPARPWFGQPFGPLADVGETGPDLLRALDPFGDAA